jgi:ATP-dependent RNA helicase DeaD
MSDRPFTLNDAGSMTDFGDLGIREELLRVLEDEDFATPTALQRAVIPVLRRGGNLVARASTGAGKTLAYALGVLDRLEPREAEDESVGIRIVVLCPTPEAAADTALALSPYAQAVGMAVTVPGGSWATPLEAAEIVAATPDVVLSEVRTSALKLDTVEAVIVDGAAAIEQIGQLEALETLLDHLPRDAQRILLSARLTGTVEDLVDRRVKRALRYPPEAAVPASAPVATGGDVGYVVVREVQKLELVARALAGREPGGAPPILFCRTDERAAEVAEALTTRGFVLGELSDEDADVVLASAGTTREELAGEAEGAAGQTISFDVPPDEETLLARHQGDADAIVLLAPAELVHLHEIAGRARLRARAVTLPLSVPAVTGVTAFREQLRRALQEEDLGAQLLVLEPLFDEFTPAEVAAACAALLRRRPLAPAPAAAAGAATAAAASRTTAPATPRALLPTDAGAPPATWARLFVGLGSRDAIKPGDLVGAIAGEANIPGSSVGRIDIRDNFSIVEVQAEVADQVISALNGTTMKGRSIRVDYDRGSDRARTPRTGRREGAPPRGPSGPRGEGGPRGGTRRTMVRRPRDAE